MVTRPKAYPASWNAFGIAKAPVPTMRLKTNTSPIYKIKYQKFIVIIWTNTEKELRKAYWGRILSNNRIWGGWHDPFKCPIWFRSIRNRKCSLEWHIRGLCNTSFELLVSSHQAVAAGSASNGWSKWERRRTVRKSACRHKSFSYGMKMDGSPLFRYCCWFLRCICWLDPVIYHTL